MKTTYILLLSIILWCISCDSKLKDTSPTASIINDCIEAHGGEAYKDAYFTYTFRDKSYVYDYNHGQYQYERITVHEKGNVARDVLTNEGFKRTIDGKEVSLTDKKIKAYSNSVNSVHYFAFLPFFLNDASVQKELLGEETIKGQLYNKVKVTFEEEGGGADFEDVYMYWIHKDNHTMDYLAYSYHTGDGGVRFRVAYNPRVIGGIRFQDYVNYKHDDANTPVANLATLYQEGKLKELSRIELKNIQPRKRVEE